MSVIRSAVASDNGKDGARAGVVDERIHSAPIVDRRDDGPPGVFSRGGIRNDARDILMLRHRLLDGAAAAAGDEHLVALVGETQRRRPTDARAAARYDHDFFVLHVRSTHL